MGRVSCSVWKRNTEGATIAGVLLGYKKGKLIFDACTGGIFNGYHIILYYIILYYIILYYVILYYVMFILSSIIL